MSFATLGPHIAKLLSLLVTISSVGCGRTGLVLDGVRGKEGVPWRCVDGMLDCDADSLNDCEIDGRRDATNCGECGAVCAVDDVCANGLCMPPSHFASISTGSHTCALRANGELWCWGSNDYGQLGLGYTSEAMLAPVRVPGLPEVVEVDASGGGTCALLRDRTIRCWGVFGDLVGLGGVVWPSPTQVAMPPGHEIVRLAESSPYRIAIAFDGQLWTWGGGTDEEHWPNPNSAAPFEFKAFGAVSQACGASEAACAVRRDGAVWCWGRAEGVGNASWDDPSEIVGPAPAADGKLDRIASVRCGVDFCVVTDAGRVQCWGYGAIRAVNEQWPPTPQPVPGVKDAVAVASGMWHDCALVGDGRVVCWGWNCHDESKRALRGNGRQCESPDGEIVGTNEVMGIQHASALSVAGGHSCVIDEGFVKCWGTNQDGVLGDGTTEPRDVATRVAFPE